MAQVFTVDPVKMVREVTLVADTCRSSQNQTYKQRRLGPTRTLERESTAIGPFAVPARNIVVQGTTEHSTLVYIGYHRKSDGAKCTFVVEINEDFRNFSHQKSYGSRGYLSEMSPAEREKRSSTLDYCVGSDLDRASQALPGGDRVLSEDGNVVELGDGAFSCEYAVQNNGTAIDVKLPHGTVRISTIGDSLFIYEVK